jgi:hypothetical protein
VGGSNTVESFSDFVEKALRILRVSEVLLVGNFYSTFDRE